ncbi:caspase family protein [Methylobacterium sp. WL7]|uniref:caspase family protein n=1 Tax=Methylobacterium sp. WL7 TaxID=2603900 RepID=UPI0011CB66D1|nr:caspase family protein [Methylobacterium sp. WL7]TXN43212.1 tetratricopeptide repeat protein [Methylobacterium sp. WL7]
MRMWGWSRLQFPLAAAIAALAALIVPAAAGGRVALVVAEAAYPDSDAVLTTPVGDAGAMAEALRHRGFTVTLAENVGRGALQAAIDRFARTVEPESVALVFFAGYGIQVNRRNYLVPVDARVWSETDVVRDGISVDGLLEILAKRQAGIRVLVLDASRRNPFERRFRSFSQGLAPIPAPQGGIAISVAAAGGLAGDGPGPRSPFVTELVRQIGTDVSVDRVFEAVRDSMAKRGNATPTPAISTDLRETFFFDLDRPRVPMDKPAPAAEAKSAPPAAAKLLPKGDGAMARTQPEALGRDEPLLTRRGEHASAAEAQPTEAYRVDERRGEQERQRLAELDDRISRNSRDEVAYYERGQFHAQRGDAAAAIADFDRSLRLNPTSPEAYNNRCWLHAVAGDLHRALADCDEALKLRPGFLDALDSRGLVNLKSGAFQAAVSDYGEALKRDARHSSALYGRGLALKRLGDVATGEKDITSAKALNPQIDKDFATYGVR